MKYRVIGARKRTGIDDSIVVDAADESDAVNQANIRGLYVSVVESMEGSTKAQIEDTITERSWEIANYTVKYCEDSLTVEGPSEDFSKLLGKRFLALLSSDEGRIVLIGSDFSSRLPELFHMANASSVSAATPRQLEFARSIGLDLPNGIGSDVVGFYLSEYQQLNFYVHFVFRCIHGMSAIDAGMGQGALKSITMEVQKNPSISSKVLALMFRRDVTGEDPPMSGNVFEVVRRLIPES